MSNETMAEVAAPAATASKGIDAELQALGRLADKAELKTRTRSGPMAYGSNRQGG